MSNQYPAVILDTIKMKPVFWCSAELAKDFDFLSEKLPDSIQDFDVIESPEDLHRYKQTEIVTMSCNMGHDIQRIKDKTSGSKKAFELMQSAKLKEFTGKGRPPADPNEPKPKKERQSPVDSVHGKAKEQIKEWYAAMNADPINAKMTRREMVIKLVEMFGLKETTAGQYIQHVRSETPDLIPSNGSTRALVFDHVKTSLFMKEERPAIISAIQEKFGLTINTAKNYYQKARQEFLNEKSKGQ